MNDIIELTENGFEHEVLEAKLPVLVDFYAPWCGPCKMLAPILLQLATEYGDRIKFAKINVDDAPRLADTYQISSVPTLMLFRDGQTTDALAGLLLPKALRDWLERAVSTASAPATKGT